MNSRGSPRHGCGSRTLGRAISLRLLFLAALPLGFQASGLQASTASACDTGLYHLSGGYPAARLGECRVLGPSHVELTIGPEFPGEINPSPWYGFHVRPSGEPRSGQGQALLQVSLVYSVHGHRYWPKVSPDGSAWRRLTEAEVTIQGDSAHLRLNDVGQGLFVSAQEILDSAHYASWLAALAETHPNVEPLVIGHSVGRLPIHAFRTNPQAKNLVLILGRQHPPEVTGGVALKAFVETLLSSRARACRDRNSNACRFYAHHDLVVVPLVNPDGVDHGHWRLNFGGVDLNRDWGPFTQPETRAVKRYFESVMAQGKTLRLMLDFHSTDRSLIYTQAASDRTNPRGFAKAWSDLGRRLGAKFDFEPRTPVDTPNTKNYFFKTYGVPAITYEVGDEVAKDEVRRSARAFAVATAELLGSDMPANDPLGVDCEDLFCHIGEVNKASLVMLTEEGLLSEDLASRIAGAIDEVLIDQAQAGAERSSNYIDFEAMLTDRIGPVAANVHIGRSRQDVHGAARRLLTRTSVLEVSEALLDARSLMIAFAQQHAGTPVPAYTHGVQSQPTTLGHQALAFSASLGRDFERLSAAYERLNLSPLGAAAGSTSGFPLNRHRIAEFLGFLGPVENTYDANFVSSSEFHLEIANALEISAVTAGQFAQNIHTLYHDPRPWILLDQAGTSGSTIMPQKRSPRALDRLRSQAGQVIGDAQTVTLMSHNTSPGMHDYRQIGPLEDLLESAMQMYQYQHALLGWLRVDAERAAEELDQGYSTMTEVADTLLREAQVPFRNAHAYAAALTDYARANKKRARALTDAELASIYEEALGETLPLDALRIRAALDPAQMIAQRKGYGGPQASEMDRMLAKHSRELGRQVQALEGERHRLDNTSNALQLAFAKYLQ